MDTSIYQEQIIDLNEHPLNFGKLDNPDFTHEGDNPLCGDVIRIDVRLDDDSRVSQVAWSGEGCAISTASVSLLTEEIKGKTLDEIKAYPGEDPETLKPPEEVAPHISRMLSAEWEGNGEVVVIANSE